MTLLEMLVSVALTVTLGGTIVSLIVAGNRMAQVQPEALDLQQRARIALYSLGTELRDAGAGLEHDPTTSSTAAMTGPLVRYFPPLVPSADNGITVWTTTNRDAQGWTAFAVAPGATTIVLQDSPVCLAGSPACGFSPGATAIAFTASGCRTTLRIAAVTADSLQLAAPLAGCSLDRGSPIAEGQVRTFRVDPAARQLIRRDEVTGSSAPMLEGAASMVVSCFGDAAGSDIVSGVSDAELMRVRRVRIAIRLVAANPLLRIPDLDVAVDVVPRNRGGG